MSQDTNAKLELQALRDHIVAELENAEYDPEMLGLITASENADDITEKLKGTLQAIDAVINLIGTVEQFLYGDIGEATFRHRWNILAGESEQRREDAAANNIGSDVLDLLERTRGDNIE